MTTQSALLKKYFNSESELQDLLTKRILEDRSMLDAELDPENDPDDAKNQIGYSAKAKQRRLD